MNLIPWNCFDEIEAYTTPKYYKNKSFNMSYNENKEEVLENRKILAKYLNTDLKHMIATHQTHSTNFIEVNKTMGGLGMYSVNDALENYDAMYTKDSDLFLLVFHADCCPVLLYARDTKIIAAIHSGWKGTVNEIVGKMTKHLIENEHCDPSQIYAYIGPSIEERNFEAKDDIINLVKKMSFDTSSFYTKKDETSYLLNSKGLIKQQLLNLNVKEENITVSPLCTIENNDLFFSYRKEKAKSRNITIIKRKDI
jgi:hypothetical protein